MGREEFQPASAKSKKRGGGRTQAGGVQGQVGSRLKGLLGTGAVSLAPVNEGKMRV